ncbi:MAG: asparagine synthase (glutamine-hydrolyzing) [Candidatus Makaraimicrobium thalassicum]|nr:MAG: asparagine synthase (glutamine-hydrolyzing) [Candidatus Omnitrophota bacterium]
MCGIAGLYQYQGARGEDALPGDAVRRMIALLAHRGPDDRGMFDDPDTGVILGNTRLAVVDLSPSGHQPMHNEDKSVWVVYNGEIYNHGEIKRELGSTHRFVSNTDTEVVVHAYEQWGVECFHKFDGMFACAILDKKRNMLFLARDRCGVKPCYYYQHEGLFAFSSELNSLRAVFHPEIDDSSVCLYLRLGFFYRTKTPYKGVSELEPGGLAGVDLETGRCSVKKWWSIDAFFRDTRRVPFQEAVAAVDDILNLSVKRRLESSDLEVGTFLSGGIDSSLITAVAARHKKGLKAFTVRFEGTYDETPLARRTAAYCGADHVTVTISMDNLKDEIEKIIGNYGEPFADSSAIPSYYVSKAAKQYLTVVLNGDGGDELFGGYRRYVPCANEALIRFARGMSFLKGIIPVPRVKMGGYNYFYRLLDFSRKTGLQMYLAGTVDIFEGHERAIRARAGYSDEIADDVNGLFSDNSRTLLRKMMNMDFNTIFSGDLMVKTDIASMAHSLEIRSPFLSREFLEYAPALPDSFKVRGIRTKHILRELACRYCPRDIAYQPKRGFEVPLKEWLEGDLRGMVFDYLFRSRGAARFVEKEFIRGLLEGAVAAPPEQRAKMLWTLFALEIWYRGGERSR